jgi:hypothetical protein
MFLNIKVKSFFVIVACLVSFSRLFAAQATREDIVKEASVEAVKIMNDRSGKSLIGWINQYRVINYREEYWVYFNYEALNRIADGGGLVLHKSEKNNHWEHFWFGHDEPDKSVPEYVVEQFDSSDNYMRLAPAHIYFGDNNAEVSYGTNRGLVKSKEIENYGVWSLKLMKNEILARYGKVFEEADIRDFFKTRTWYKENAKQKTFKLTKTEKENIKTIEDLLKQKTRTSDSGK